MKKSPNKWSRYQVRVSGPNRVGDNLYPVIDEVCCTSMCRPENCLTNNKRYRVQVTYEYKPAWCIHIDNFFFERKAKNADTHKNNNSR